VKALAFPSKPEYDEAMTTTQQRPTQAEVDAFVAAGLARLARMFTGPETKDFKGRGTGHMPAWFMPEDEWAALGSPATAADWQQVMEES
jgi:hypothetical protein